MNFIFIALRFRLPRARSARTWCQKTTPTLFQYESLAVRHNFDATDRPRWVPLSSSFNRSQYRHAFSAYLWWGPNECNFERVPCAVIVRINRLLRLPRMWEWFERTETATGYPNAFRICKVSFAPRRFIASMSSAIWTWASFRRINISKRLLRHDDESLALRVSQFIK